MFSSLTTQYVTWYKNYDYKNSMLNQIPWNWEFPMRQNFHHEHLWFLMRITLHMTLHPFFRILVFLLFIMKYDKLPGAYIHSTEYTLQHKLIMKESLAFDVMRYETWYNKWINSADKDGVFSIVNVLLWLWFVFE